MSLQRPSATFWRGALGVLLAVAWTVSAHLASAGIGPLDLRVAVAFVPLALALVLLAWQSPRRGPATACALLLAGSGALLGWPWLRGHFTWLFCLQHLGMHLALAAWFGGSLLPGRVPAVTAMARLIHAQPLDAATLRYTRGVTWLWTLFFLANGALSLLLFAWAPVEVWSLHANVLTGPLVALVFLAEMLVRRRVLPAQQRPALRDMIRSWRLHSAGGHPPPRP